MAVYSERSSGHPTNCYYLTAIWNLWNDVCVAYSADNDGIWQTIFKKEDTPWLINDGNA